MTSELRAGIDIGTNTILMVIGRRRADGTFDIVRDEHAIARLGEGLGQTGRISDAAEARAVEILGRYRAILGELGVTVVNAVATSAMRDAANAADIHANLQAALGAPIDVIDGAEEARLTFLGTVGDSPAPCTVVDIGGGSTEVAYGQHGTIIRATSMQVGVVRLTERYMSSKPPTDDAVRAARSVLATVIDSALLGIPHGTLHAVAGTPVALAALDLGLTDHDRDRIEGHVLTFENVGHHVDRLLAMTADELRALPGVHPQRADVLPAGALILHEVMRALVAGTCIVSTRGLRFGVMNRR